MASDQPTREQLAAAHRAARLRGSLEEALQSPVLALCLRRTAEAHARPQPARIDFKRIAAADQDLPI